MSTSESWSKDFYKRTTKSCRKTTWTPVSLISWNIESRPEMPRRRVRGHTDSVSPKEKKVRDMVAEFLDAGMIRESTSPWACPIVLVKKKDGSMRFCCDWRKLNEKNEERRSSSSSDQRHDRSAFESEILPETRFHIGILSGEVGRKFDRKDGIRHS